MIPQCLTQQIEYSLPRNFDGDSHLLALLSGVYNETAFAALDYILDTAAYNNVKVIFIMGDNWQYMDSKRNVSIILSLDLPVDCCH